MHERNETRTRRIANTALAALFLAGIAVCCVGTFFGLDTGGIPGENRAMTPASSLLKGRLRDLPDRTNQWFNDHFGLRNSFVKLNSGVLLRAFGVSSSSDVVVGKNGWLFYAADRIIESRRGLVPFTDDELRAWQAKIEERRDWLASQGIRYVFMIAPEKSSLYAELLPDELAVVRDETRLDQLVAWMGAHSTVNVLDLRPSLNAAKAEGRVWHKTDTHWNDEGAYAAYAQIAAWLKAEFPAVEPVAKGEFDRQVHPGPGGDLAGMLALMTRMSEDRIVLAPKSPGGVREMQVTEAMTIRKWLPEHGPVVYECDNAPPVRAVVLHDSFFQQVQPFLSRNFARTTYVWWVFPPEIIAAEKPDVVIEEMVERVLSRPGFLPINEPPVAGFTAAE